MRNGKSLVFIFAASICLAACQQYTLDGSIGSSIGIKVTSKSNPASKGAIITTDAMNTANKTFHIEGWLGEEIITAVNAASADKENRHFLSEVLTYSGSTWNMSSQNFWRNDIPTTFWSYVDPAEGPKPVFTWPGLPSWRFVNPLSRVSCA